MVANNGSCVICGGQVWAPGNDPYCRIHREERYKRRMEAIDRFHCSRITRGGDFEVFSVDHEQFGNHCAQFTVMKTGDGSFNVVMLLMANVDWEKAAYELPGDPEPETLESVVSFLPIDESIEGWGGGEYFITTYLAGELNEWHGDL